MTNNVSWLSVNPLVGVGNATITCIADTHTGRNSRKAKITITSPDSSISSKTREIIQAGKPEFINISEGFTDIQIPVAGTEQSLLPATITGTSNCKGLKAVITEYTIANSDLYDTEDFPSQLTIAQGYDVNGVIWTLGNEITGDPGAGEAYSFKIMFGLPENNIASARRYKIRISSVTNPNTYKDILVTHSSDSAFMTVTDGNFNIAADGGPTNAAKINVNSNVTWNVDVKISISIN